MSNRDPYGPSPCATPRGAGPGFLRRRWLVVFWMVLLFIVFAGYALGLDRQAVAAAAIIWGLASQIFAVALSFAAGLLGGIPVLGPVIVKVITIPLVLLINGLAFLASLVGIKIGHKRRVFESRVAATILMIGILIGYILGKLI